MRTMELSRNSVLAALRANLREFDRAQTNMRTMDNKQAQTNAHIGISRNSVLAVLRADSREFDQAQTNMRTMEFDQAQANAHDN